MASGKKLSGQIFNGLFWASIGRGVQSLLQFLVVIVLARLVSPEDFGLIAAAMIVIGLSEIITEIGLEAALVQRTELNPEHISTAFTTSVGLGCLGAAILYFSAEPIGGFFRSEGFVPVLKVLVWLFPIRAVGTVGQALAQRELRFKWLAIRDILSFGIGYFICGFALALLGFGVWSLVAATIGAAVLRTMMVIYEYPPRGLKVTVRAIRDLAYFGGGHTIARITNYFALQGDNLVVARTLDLFSLGIYGRAYQLMNGPATMFGQVLDRVLFPSMAKLQNRRDRLAEAYLQGVGLIGLVMIPVSAVGIIVAPEIVMLLLGRDWAPVALPLRILLVGLLMRTSYKLSDSLARATGAVYRRAWRQAMYAVAVVGGAWLGHFYGVPGVAAGVLVAVTANFALMAQLSLVLTGRSWADFLDAHSPGMRAAVVAVVTALPLTFAARTGGIAEALIPLVVIPVSAAATIAAIALTPGVIFGRQDSPVAAALGRVVDLAVKSRFPLGSRESAENT